MKRNKILLLLLLFSILLVFFGFEIINRISLSGVKNFYIFSGIGISYIIILLISAILIVKAENTFIYKLLFILIVCIYSFFTLFLIKILIP